MKLHDLKPNPGSKKARTRVGRGIAAGKGKTAGRGTKGQRSRAGFGGSLHRQGGNLPLYRKLPFMRGEGFTPINRVEYNEINVDTLAARFRSGTEVTPGKLAEKNLLHKKNNPVVVLGRGEIDKPLKLKVHRITKSAREKVEAAGGTVDILE